MQRFKFYKAKYLDRHQFYKIETMNQTLSVEHKCVLFQRQTCANFFCFTVIIHTKVLEQSCVLSSVYVMNRRVMRQQSRNHRVHKFAFFKLETLLKLHSICIFFYTKWVKELNASGLKWTNMEKMLRVFVRRKSQNFTRMLLSWKCDVLPVRIVQIYVYVGFLWAYIVYIYRWNIRILQQKETRKIKALFSEIVQLFAKNLQMDHQIYYKI